MPSTLTDEGSLMSTGVLPGPPAQLAGSPGRASEAPKRTTSWPRRQVLLVGGVLIAVGALAWANRDAIDPSLWTRRIELGWLAVAVLGSALSLAGNAWNLMGASPVRLPFWPTYGAQAAGTVARLVSPAALGGAAVNVQYLRRAGLGNAASVGTVSVAQTVQLVSAFVLLPPVAVAAGLNLSGVISVSGLAVVLAAAAVLAALAVGAVFLLRRRPLLEAKVRVMVAELLSSLRTMARRPGRAALSLLGALLITVALVGTLWASVYAFGGSVGLLTASAVLLFGSSAGNVLPVPGGVGTVDTALAAALVAAGVELSVAIPAVALHRLLTLWLQVPAGLAAAYVLRRRGAL